MNNCISSVILISNINKAIRIEKKNQMHEGRQINSIIRIKLLKSLLYLNYIFCSEVLLLHKT